VISSGGALKSSRGAGPLGGPQGEFRQSGSSRYRTWRARVRETLLRGGTFSSIWLNSNTACARRAGRPRVGSGPTLAGRAKTTARGGSPSIAREACRAQVVDKTPVVKANLGLRDAHSRRPLRLPFQKKEVQMGSMKAVSDCDMPTRVRAASGGREFSRPFTKTKMELRLPFCTCGREKNPVRRNRRAACACSGSGSLRYSARASEGGDTGWWNKRSLRVFRYPPGLRVHRRRRPDRRAPSTSRRESREAVPPLRLESWKVFAGCARL